MKRFIFVLLLAGIVVFSVNAQVSFETSIDAESVLVGTNFKVSFTLYNAEGQNFQPPSFANFDVITGPNRAISTSIINGSRSSSISYYYVLVANNPGKFVIGAASIRVGNKILKTNSVQINVQKSSKTLSQKSSNKIFIKTILSKDKVYLNEQFTVTYKLYTQVNIENIEASVTPKFDLFQKEYVALGQNPAVKEIYNGEQYITKVLSKIILFPLKTGIIEIPSSSYRVYIQEDSDDPFGFSMPSIFNTTASQINSESPKIEVKALPNPIPNSFSGAVGKFEIEYTKVNQKYTMADAIELNIVVKGDGNFNILKPRLFANDSTIHFVDAKESETKVIAEEDLSIKQKSFQYFITPNKTGTYTLKPSFIYFDPNQGKYINIADSLGFSVDNSTTSQNNNLSISSLKPIQENMKLQYSTFNIFNGKYLLGTIVIPIILTFLLLYLGKIRDKFKRNSIEENNYNPDQQNLSLDIVEKLWKAKVIHLLQLDNSDYSLYALKSNLYAAQATINAITALEILNKLEEMKFSKYEQHDLKQLLQAINSL